MLKINLKRENLSIRDFREFKVWGKAHQPKTMNPWQQLKAES
ncbi:hypothetical protein BJP36_43975 [Moorena producens JHB]|uniref:Uncharacterized protein n=1 Tax=Moorena producens (strain JHB) TaxID=1454205 RepID=A0A9Q9UVY8_MOOP1|nr:hypothetical protein [Moorena producens]WAN69319.1 hypothetical protein BJP36_43975 [Moorena producens JHB]